MSLASSKRQDMNCAQFQFALYSERCVSKRVSIWARCLVYIYTQHTLFGNTHTAREAAGACALWLRWCLNECIDIAIAGLRFNFLALANKSCEFQHIFPHPPSPAPEHRSLSLVRIFIAWNAKQPAWSVAVNAQRTQQSVFAPIYVTCCQPDFLLFNLLASRCVQRFRLMKRFHTLLSESELFCFVSLSADGEFWMFLLGFFNTWNSLKNLFKIQLAFSRAD